ncbi:MAG: hypothetical protein PVJ49_15860 [Acidobacteriota bacterium]|jgi:hypothetical protein
MMNFTGGFLFLIGWLVWLGVSIYLLVLATRFVNAVELIAARMQK